MKNHIMIARQLVRLAKSLVAGTYEEEFEKRHNDNMNACKEFPGLEGFFAYSLMNLIPESQQDAFVELLRRTKRSGHTVKKKDYERFSIVSQYEFSIISKWLEYLEMMRFNTLQDFNYFIDNESKRIWCIKHDLKNPNDVIKALEIEPEENVRLNIANSDIVTPEILSYLANDVKDSVKMAVASNKTTPPSALKKLARDGSEDIRVQVAKNTNTPVEELAFLAENGNEDARAEVALNPSTPAEVLEYLADDESRFVQRLVIENENTPMSVLLKFSNDKSFCEDVVKNQKATEDMLSSIFKSNNDNIGVLSSIAKHRNTSHKILAELAKHSSKHVRAAVAGNESTPLDVLDELSKDTETIVLAAVAMNKNTPDTVLLYLVKKYLNDDDICGHLAQNPLTPVAALRLIAEQGSHCVKWYLTGNPSTTTDILTRLANDEDVCYNTECLVEIACHKNTDPGVLEHLSKNNDEDVREAVARNPHTPVDVLRMMAEDKYEYVEISQAARENPSYREK